MFTDIVGYSAMSQKNEDVALELLELHRGMLRESFLTFKGNEIKTIGDAFLVEYGSALDAVNCSIDIQQRLEVYNRDCGADRNIFLRIGIHVGDVVHRDGDIYGDGVNISSRLEPLAQPGGICISEDVARQVRNKLKVPVEKMDKQDLKNIELPVEIYQIQLFKNPVVKQTVIENNKLAVLPFQNISPDNETDYFSDGLTEELIMHLSRIKELQVVSRTTTMHFKNTQKDIHAIGKELSARYVLEGSVRKHMDDLRITAQLIDVKTDSHLWAETYKGNISDIFDIQESVAKQIVQALRVTLSPEEQVELGKRSTLNTQAFELNLHAREFLFRKVKSYLLAAIDLFQNAVELDPRYASAYAGLGVVYVTLYEAFDKNASWLEKAMESSFKALMYDATSSEAYSALGLVYYNKGQYDEALASVRKAIELDSNDFLAFWILGRIYRAQDHELEAAVEFEKVLKLNPDFHTAYIDLLNVYGRLEDKEKHREVSDRAIAFYPTYLMRHPDDARAIMFYSANLLEVGQVDEAKSKMARAIELSPNDASMMYNAACFYSRIGENAKSLEHLQMAISNGFESYEYIKRDPDFDNVRNEPGFIELMKGH